MVRSWILVLSVAAAVLASCGPSFQTKTHATERPLGARGAGDATTVSSNVRRADYAGSAACAACHADIAAPFAASPMRNMTRNAQGAVVHAPFDGTVFRFKRESVTLETKGVDRWMHIDTPGVDRLSYKVTRVIGGRVREDFAGTSSDGGDERVLPVSFLMASVSLMVAPEPHGRRRRLEPVLHLLPQHQPVPALAPRRRCETRAVVPGRARRSDAPRRSRVDAGSHRRRSVWPRRRGGDAGHRRGRRRRASPRGSRHRRSKKRARAFGDSTCSRPGLAARPATEGAGSTSITRKFGHRSFPRARSFVCGTLARRPPPNASPMRAHAAIRFFSPGTRGPGKAVVATARASAGATSTPAKRATCSSVDVPKDSRVRRATIRTPKAIAGANVSPRRLPETRFVRPATPNTPKKAAFSRHSHHSPEGAAGTCIACHMPKKNMSLTSGLTRYHRIGSPTDPMRVMLDRPLECALCHTEKTVEQVATDMERLWGKHYERETLRALYGGLDENVLLATLERGKPHEQAVALAVLGAAKRKDAAPYAVRALGHPFPLVREYAKNALEAIFGTRCAIDLSAPADRVVEQGQKCGEFSHIPRLPAQEKDERANGHPPEDRGDDPDDGED